MTEGVWNTLHNDVYETGKHAFLSVGQPVGTAKQIWHTLWN